MQCPNCATDADVGQPFCTRCGTSLLAPAPLSPSPESPLLPSPARPLRFAGGVLLTLAAIGLDISFTYHYYHSEWTSEAVGYCIGSLILPFVVAYLVAGVKKRRNWLWFSLCFFGLTIMSAFSTAAGHHKGFTDLPPNQMYQIMTGVTPLPDDASEDDKETVAETKAIFADLRQMDSSYNQRQSALAPDLNKLYTASAFSNRPAMQHMLSIVQQKLALDNETFTKIQQMPQMMAAHLEKSHLSELGKKDFLKGATSQFQSSEIIHARQQSIVAEHDWGSATIDLYNFALEHSSQITVDGASIRIGSPGVRDQFNRRLQHAQESSHAFNASVQKVFAARKAVMQSVGVTPADMGLSK